MGDVVTEGPMAAQMTASQAAAPGGPASGRIPPAAKPAHVSDEFVYDFDMYTDPGLLADPHARIMQMLDEAPPVFWTPRNGGHWMIMSHGANFKASRDPDSFSNQFVPAEQLKAMNAGKRSDERVPTPMPIGLDPPTHATYRLPLQGTFSPKHVNKLKDHVRDLARSLVGAVRPRGECEFMGEVAEQLPVRIFLEMLGLPVERLAEYRQLVKEHMSMSIPDPTAAGTRTRRIASVMRPTMLERKENPRDDIISLLWSYEIDGRPTTIEDMEDYGVVLFTAGLDTVMNGMGFGVRHLALHPELQDQLRADPKLIPEAAEEILRRYTFTVPPRRVARDLEFEGVQMKTGERAMLFLPAADLTGSEYPNPDRFDLGRENKVHIAFGAGPHRCLGSHLARVELNILYEEVLAGLPPFRLDPDHAPAFHGGHVVGPDTVYLRWDA